MSEEGKMSITYDLEMDADLSARQAMALLASRFGDELHEGRFLDRREIWSSAADYEAESIREAFHFTSNLSVGFVRPKEEDIKSEFDKSMLRATIWLLEHARDAVLLFNHEIIVLQRLGGQLVFNSDHWLWEDEEWVKQVVGAPFERRKLPSPLL